MEGLNEKIGHDMTGSSDNFNLRGGGRGIVFLQVCNKPLQTMQTKRKCATSWENHTSIDENSVLQGGTDGGVSFTAYVLLAMTNYKKFLANTTTATQQQRQV